MLGRSNLLIHFFDKEVLDLYSTSRYDQSIIETDFRSALKLGFLFCPGQLLLPLSSYFESEIVAQWADEWGPLFAAQEFQIVSSELDYELFVELKREQYKREPRRHPAYYDKKVAFKLRDLAAPLARRIRSSTSDIAVGWQDQFQRDQGLITGLAKTKNTKTVAQFERALIEVPERLSGDAFIWDYVRPLLPVSALSPEQTYALKALISRCYVRSYLDEFAAYIIGDLRVGDLRCGLRPDEIQSIQKLRQITKICGILEAVEALTWVDVLYFKYDAAFRVFAEIIRLLTSLQETPISVLQAIQFARRKIPEGKSRDNLVRATATLTEELASIDIFRLGSVLAPSGIVHGKQADWDRLLNDVLSIGTGAEDAHEYEISIERLLTALFDPVLTDPKLQVQLHEGRKRVDITYRNMASAGFFNWLPKHYAAPYIYVECKNYNKKIGNPELDQLAGRFSPIRGQFGLLVCRKIEDRISLMQSCCDTALDHRGFIVPLDDDDLKKLVEQKKNGTNFFDLPLFKMRFDQLVKKDFSK